jgi:ankyrin repeat protein
VTGARLNLRDKDNNSVVLNACFSGKTAIVKYLVSNGNGPSSSKRVTNLTHLTRTSHPVGRACAVRRVNSQGWRRRTITTTRG